MPNFENIIDLIRRCKTPNIIVSDMYNNKIICIENNTENATIQELEGMEEMLKGYGKLQITGATESQQKSNYKGAYKWLLIFDKAIASNQMNGMPGMTGIGWGQAPPGFVSNDVMMAKLESIQKDIAHAKEIAELKKSLEKPEDQIEKYMGYAPMMMSALGHSDEKVEKMIKWYAMSKMNGTNQSMAFVPTNTLTFKDIEKMTPEQKNAKIQALLNSLGTKVSAEHMILLLEAIDKKPELAEKAVNMLSML